MATEEKGFPPSGTRSEIGELLDLYLDGMDIELLAVHFQETPRNIVVRLSELLLGVPNPIQNPKAKNYGKTWNWAEISRLRRMYAVRIPISRIAETLGRDELGVCFRLLSEQMIVLPKKLVKEFNLDEDCFGVGSEKKPSKSVCSSCSDVVIYCKCQEVGLSVRLDEN